MWNENIPAIVNWGSGFISRYTEYDLKGALVQEFVDRRSDYIILDSNRTLPQFRAASVAWGMREGFLFNSYNDYSDDQCTVHHFRLTELGKKEFGIA